MIDWSTISLKELAGFLSEGGACATIYSENRYQSYGLDYITYEDMKKVKRALLELGFSEKSGYFQHKDCQWLVEFVSPPVAVGSESIREFSTVETSLGAIKLLRAEDSVKDRLASFYHWNDKQGLQQAINLSGTGNRSGGGGTMVDGRSAARKTLSFRRASKESQIFHFGRMISLFFGVDNRPTILVM